VAGLLSLDRTLLSKVGERKSTAYLVELGQDGSPTGAYRRFQYFPETVQDSYSPNWQTREVPGATLPIYEWINGSAREISFTAFFTSDVDLLADYATGVGFSFGTVADRLKQQGVQDRNVDIRAAVLWLRRFLMATYQDQGAVGVPLVNPPPRLLLCLPNSGIGLGAGQTQFVGTNDQVLSIMTGCDVTYEAFFPTGLPRIASVALTFAQVAQLPSGEVIFPAYEDRSVGAELNGDYAQNPTGLLGYNLTENRWK
jgi:hypothetical protein